MPMMAIPILPQPPRLRREDLASPELRAYLRHEYRGDVSLLYVRRPHRQPGVLERVRRRLSRSRADFIVPTAANEPVGSACPAPSQETHPQAPPRTPIGDRDLATFAPGIGLGCTHMALEELGGGSGVSYSLCVSCGTVLVLTSVGGWALPPVDPRDPREHAATVPAPLGITHTFRSVRCVRDPAGGEHADVPEVQRGQQG